eukprot:TRINITY_DN4495_c1_g1_i9.p1 TRINITY_DN4495_c1_g1~~TRINITY_DN4495_c1_g1_i9.p1  ORF type:complete len:170 (+),score=18.29 TRINITY_DN4495_c1_g1_i9:232-741(+)
MRMQEIWQVLGILTTYRELTNLVYRWVRTQSTMKLLVMKEMLTPVTKRPLGRCRTLLLRSSKMHFQGALGNEADSDTGDANAGNERETGDVTSSLIDFEQVSLYNDATSNTGDANSGNIDSFGDISGSLLSDSQTSLGNTAQSNTGDANSGNILNFGSLFGRRKLLRLI